MKSISSPEYRAGGGPCYLPVVHAYYDRADMLATTANELSHAHTLCEIMYVNDGSIRVVTEGQCAFVGQRQFIWLDASVRHQLILDDSVPCGVMNIEFQLEALEPRMPSFAALCRAQTSLRAMLEEGPAYAVLTDSEGTVYNLMKQIILLADSTHPEAETLCSWLTGQVMLEVARYFELNGARSGVPVRNRYVAEAVAYLGAHYLDGVTAGELARMLHIQPSYLHRLFKEHMRMTIGEYINGLRLARARELLAGTDQTLLQISVACGFSSQQRFTELFRREYGMTPTEYRERKEEREDEKV